MIDLRKSDRAKREDNGCWVYGYFYQDIWGDDSTYIQYDNECIKVIPETFEANTGFSDKNNVPIYTGNYVTINGSLIYNVAYSREIGGFVLKSTSLRNRDREIDVFDNALLSTVKTEAIEIIADENSGFDIID